MAEEDLYQTRLEKLDALVARGTDPWPAKFDRTHLAAELKELFDDLPPGEDTTTSVRVAGRLKSSRTQGKLAFGDIADQSGQIQLFVTGDAVASFDEFDSGDIVGASGRSCGRGGASFRCAPTTSCCSRKLCVLRRTSGTACKTLRSATGSGTWT